MIAPSLRWKRRNNGTGSVLSTVHLGSDEGSSECPGEWYAEPQGPLARVVCDVLYFAPEPSDTDTARAAARQLAVARLEALRTSLLHSPMVVKPMARGKYKSVNVHNNYGDLVYAVTSTSPATEATILSNCTLEEASVVDDSRTRGVILRLVFARVSDSHQP